MNLVAPQDRLLVAGLAAAMVVVFAKPLRRLLELANDAEKATGLSLVQGLIILTVVFIIHQMGKGQEARVAAAAAEAAANQAEERAEESDALLTFGQALGRSLDLDSIREVVAQQLPKLTGTGDAWVLLRDGETWMSLDRGREREVPPSSDVGQALGGGIESPTRRRADIADRAIILDGPWPRNPVATDGHVCLPLTAGGHAVGFLGVPQPGELMADAQRRILGTAAAMLAIALRNAQLFDEVRENSVRDGLTGCFNRTHALEVIDIELRLARRSQLPVSLIMFDLDRFKQINDRYGHLCGDAVLSAVGGQMREVLRGSDLKCRYGGEEFLVLLPETPLEGAKRVADTLRREIGDIRLPWKGETLQITASFGVTVALPSEIDRDALIGRADAALYHAKDQGRNCVRLSVESAVA